MLSLPLLHSRCRNPSCGIPAIAAVAGRPAPSRRFPELRLVTVVLLAESRKSGRPQSAESSHRHHLRPPRTSSILSSSGLPATNQPHHHAPGELTVLRDPSIVPFDLTFVAINITGGFRRRFMVAAGDSGDHRVRRDHQQVRRALPRPTRTRTTALTHGIDRPKIDSASSFLADVTVISA